MCSLQPLPKDFPGTANSHMALVLPGDLERGVCKASLPSSTSHVLAAAVFRYHNELQLVIFTSLGLLGFLKNKLWTSITKKMMALSPQSPFLRPSSFVTPTTNGPRSLSLVPTDRGRGRRKLFKISHWSQFHETQH